VVIIRQRFPDTRERIFRGNYTSFSVCGPRSDPPRINRSSGNHRTVAGCIMTESQNAKNDGDNGVGSLVPIRLG
jgi:hypothetical protein